MNNKLNTKDNAKVVFSLINTIIYALLFLTIFIFFYGEVNYFINGNTILLFIYVVLLVIFSNLFGAFELGETTVRDLLLSQTIASFFTNGLIYFIICLLALKMLTVWPTILLQAVEMIISALLNFYENRFIRDNYPALKAIAIVGENHYSILDKIDKYRDITVSVVRKYDEKDIDFDDLDEILKGVDRVITVDIDHDQKKKVFKACYERYIRVFDIPSITDMLLASSDILHLIDTPLLKVNKFGPSPLEAAAKRSIDIIGSLILIIITSPIMLITAIAVKLNDGGDILFRQTRLTKGEKEFNIYKFRSMIMNAEAKTGAVLAKEDDDRITKVGKIIRKTRIDELPQLFNILKGDMSFVGPRPERPEIYQEIIKDMPEFKYRLVVKSGLTGYAQIYGKYNTTMRDKLLLDIYYIENYSLIDDIKLLFMTFKIVFVSDSAEGIKEQL